MNNKKEEIQLQIDSMMRKLSDLSEEYENLGGKITYVFMANYDGSGYHRLGLNGYADDIGRLVMSDEDMQNIVMRHIELKVVRDLIAELEDAENE